MPNTEDNEHRPWTFLTSHARVLNVIAKNPDLSADGEGDEGRPQV